jgi:hypothetical protein
MYIYRWHAERLIALPKGQIEIFLSEVQAGRKLHPQCPRIGHLFNHHNSETKREHLRIRLDKSPLDYYYGQMGGTCLSLRSEEILKPDFFVLRLSNLQTREIIGFSIAVKEREKPTSVGPRRWLAFGFNIAPSMRTKFTANEKLLIYLHFRYVYEKLAQQTKTPVLLCGIGARMIISNDEEWQKLILRFEPNYRTTARAFMSDFVDQADAFKLAIVMVDLTDLKTFRAHNFFRWRNEKGTAV